MHSLRGKYTPLAAPGHGLNDGLESYFDEDQRSRTSDREEVEKIGVNQWSTGKRPRKDGKCRLSFSACLAFSLSLFAAFLSGVAITLTFTSGGARSQLAQANTTGYPPAKDAIEPDTVRFTGAAFFDDSGEPFFRYDADQARYFGTPTDDMDALWDTILSKRYFLISDEEALAAWGPDYRKYYKWPGDSRTPSGYVAGLDVLHQLHCVNYLRKALYPEYYNATGSETFRRYHNDHCLDVLRQSIQCSSDTTLNPQRWWPGLGIGFVDSDQVHTCRNFNRIRDWASQRWDSWHQDGNSDMPPVEVEHV